MAGVRSKRRPGGKYQGWFINYRNLREWFTGTGKKTETLRIAQKLEDEHRQIRLGYRDLPSSASRFLAREFREVTDEYLAWGKSQGGRGGRPWGKSHLKERINKLRWWEERLHIKTLSDLIGILPHVEIALRGLQEGGYNGERNGVSPKTLKNYAETMRTFCTWAKKRGYLDHNPLEDMVHFNGEAVSQKRVLNPKELLRVMAVAPDHRRLLYELALTTGLRAGELRALTLKCVDLNREVLILDSAWTKNRKSGLQPIPRELAERLIEYGKSGNAKDLYQKHYGRSDARVLDIPENPLLFVSTHPSRELEKDLRAAGIPKNIPGEGKVDFHSLRACFVTNIIDSGANAKEAQELARHSNPNLTMNIYAKTRKESLAAIVDKVSTTLSPHTERVICVSKSQNEDSSESPISSVSNDLDAAEDWWRRRDSNPRPVTGTRQALHA